MNSKKWKDYDKVTKEFQELSKKTYSENNKKVVDGKKPEFFEQILWKIKEKKPEYVMILPWNLKDEVEGQLSYIRDWRGKFVVAVPELQVF